MPGVVPSWRGQASQRRPASLKLTRAPQGGNREQGTSACHFNKQRVLPPSNLEPRQPPWCCTLRFGIEKNRVLGLGSYGAYQISVSPDSHSPMHACMRARSLQSCSTLCNPMDCSPPVSSVHGILQVRILERAEYWSGLPFPCQGIFLNQGLNLSLLLGRQILYG